MKTNLFLLILILNLSTLLAASNETPVEKIFVLEANSQEIPLKGANGDQVVAQLNSQPQKFYSHISRSTIATIDLTCFPFMVLFADGHYLSTQALLITSDTYVWWIGIDPEEALKLPGKAEVTFKGLIAVDMMDSAESSQPHGAKKQAHIDLKTLFPCINPRNHEPIIKIPVLDQTQARNGQHTCGYHAWKNAFILLAAANNDSETPVSLLTSKTFFNEIVFRYLSAYLPKNQIARYQDYDIDISALIAATNDLVTKNATVPEKLKPFAKYLPSISILNYFGEGSMNLLLTSGAGSISLNEIGKAYNAMSKDGPLTHAFVVGGSGHWVALIMQKNAHGKITWLGCDSWSRNSVNKQLVPIQQYLLTLMANKENLKAAIAPAYKELVPTLVTFAKNVKDDGSPVGNTTWMLENPFVIEQTLIDLELSYHFLAECCLLNEDHFKNFTNDVKKLVKFYCTHLNDAKYSEYLERFQKLSKAFE